MNKRRFLCSALVLAETIVQDLRQAVRALRKSSGFTITSIAVLGLAIGANTAMFSVLNAVLLKPLPFPSPDQLAMLWSESPSQNIREGRSAYWNVEQWQKESKSFAEIAAFDPVSVTVTAADEAERMTIVRTTPNLFPLLGIQPLHGRLFGDEDADRRQRTAVISNRFWQRRFGGSPGAIGATIEIDGVASRIVGIIPSAPRFAGLGADVWEPHTAFPDWEVRRVARGAGAWFVVARLQPDATFERAQEEMNAIARNLDEQLPAAGRNRGVSVVPLSLQITGSRARLALWMLSGAVFCVLLIAASNVANLTLARGATREREIATRAALGASRVRLAGQLLSESLTLAFMSGLLGMLVAEVSLRMIVALEPAELARLDSIGLDPQVLGWALAICLLTGVLVGLAPAITPGRRNAGLLNREVARGITRGIAMRGVRRSLVVTQFALSIVLLVGAGLLIRSVWSVQNIDPGFRPGRVLSVQLSVPALRTEVQRIDFYRRVLEQTASLPGVQSAGVIGDFFIGGSPEQIVTTDGSADSERLRLRRDEISEELFQTVGAPLLRGRFFSIDDGPDSARVAIVNEVMARSLWPGRNALGERFKLGVVDAPGPWFTVVGVVGDMRRQGPEAEPIAQMFEPLAQNPSRLATLLVRTAGDDPLSMAGAVQAAVHRVERYAPAYGITTLENRLGGFLTDRRFQSSLLVAFSLAALLIAAIGIYGLMQYSVAARTQEIGIRLAVGAGTGEIFRLILREGLTLSLIGLFLGLMGSLWVAKTGSSLVFAMTAADSWIFIAVSLLLIAVAAIACYFPARRAMKVSLIVALRPE